MPKVDPNYFESVRKIALMMPAVEEYICHNTPAFKVGEKLLARMQEDGKILAVHSNKKENWIKLNPEVFSITFQQRNSTKVFIDLSKATNNDVKQVLVNGWKEIAPKRVLKEYLKKEEANYSGFRSVPIYGMLICAFIIILIGIYLTISNNIAFGPMGGRRSGSLGGLVIINGPTTIITGIIVSLFPVYEIVREKIKRIKKDI